MISWDNQFKTIADSQVYFYHSSPRFHTLFLLKTITQEIYGIYFY